jgi:ABC-2 type transport system ATP-binding protein
VIINKGRIVATDTPERLQESLRGARELRVTVRGARDAVDPVVRGVPGVAGVEWREADGLLEGRVRSAADAEVREALSAAIVRGGFGLMEMASVGMSLEEIFLTLTTEEPAAREVAEA